MMMMVAWLPCITGPAQRPPLYMCFGQTERQTDRLIDIKHFPLWPFETDINPSHESLKKDIFFIWRDVYC